MNRLRISRSPIEGAMEPTESRTFPAAVEKHEAESETPPGHAPPGSI